MDPVSGMSAVAAAAGLVDLGLKLAKFLVELSRAIEDLPESVRSQTEQVEQLIALARLVQVNGGLQTDSVAKVLGTCFAIAESLHRTLQTITIKKGERLLRRVWKSVDAVTGKISKIEELSLQLERQKSTLVICIQEHDSRCLDSLASTTEEVQKDISKFSQIMENTAQEVSGVVTTVAQVSGAVTDMNRTVTKALQEMNISLVQTIKRRDAVRMDPPPSNTGKTFYTFPRRHVTNFLGREEVLQKIDTVLTLDEDTPIVVIRALGGQGKSQVALAYCRQVKRAMKCWSVFWVDATSEDTLKKDFEAIAQLFKEPGETINHDQWVDFALEKLEVWSQPWLMVLDGYDDPSSFNIRQYISYGGNGHILVTSRHADTDDLTTPNKVVALPGLREDYAVELLLQKSRIKQDEATFEDAKQIVELMGCHPLAITQAGSYIHLQRLKLDEFMAHYTRQMEAILKHTPTMSLYLKKLKENEKERALNVFTTWELSFRQILAKEDTGQVEANFLTLFAFFDCKNISENLFAAFASDRKLYEDSTGLSSSFKLVRKDGEWDSDKFRNILANLAQSALLQTWTPSRDTSDNWCHFTLHPLIRDWILLRIDPKTFAQCYVIATLSISQLLNPCWNHDEFDLDLFSKGSIQSHIGAHFKHKTSLIEQGKFPVGDFKEQLLVDDAEFFFAIFLLRFGQYDKANTVTQQVIEWRQTNLGYEHQSTIIAHIRHFAVLVECENMNLAEMVAQENVSLCDRVFGGDHIETFNSCIDLASVLVHLSKLREAVSIYEDRLGAFESKFGPTHHVSLRSSAVRGFLLIEQGKFTEAEMLLRKTEDTEKRIFGANHSSRLATLEKLGRCLYLQKRYDEAEILFLDCARRRELKFGLEHASTLRCFDMVVNVLVKTSRGKDGIELVRPILDHVEKFYGIEHIQTLEWRGLLVVMLYVAKDWSECESLCRRHLELLTKVYTAEDPQTLSYESTLGSIIQAQGRFRDTEELYIHLLETRRKVQGPEHEETLDTLARLGICYLNEPSRFPEAEALFKDALCIANKTLEPNDPLALLIRFKFTESLLCRDKLEESESIIELAYKDDNAQGLGLDGVSVMHWVGLLAQLRGKQMRYEESAAFSKILLDFQRQNLGHDASLTLQTQKTYADALTGLGRSAEAIELYRNTAEHYERRFGTGNELTFAARLFLACCLEGIGVTEEASLIYHQLLLEREKLHGPVGAVCTMGPSDTDILRDYLRNILLDQKKYHEVEEVWVSPFRYREQQLGLERADLSLDLKGLESDTVAPEDYARAEITYSRLFEVRSKVFGLHHIATIGALFRTAEVCSIQQKHTKAAETYRRVADILKTKIPHKESDVIFALDSRLVELLSQKEFVEVENTSREIFNFVKLSPTTFGPEKVSLLGNAANALGWSLLQQAKYEEAEQIFENLARLREMVLGLENPLTIDGLQLVAGCMSLQLRPREAEVMYWHVWQLQKKVLGLEHPDTLGTLCSICECLIQQKRLSKAENLLQELLDIREKVLGPNDLVTLLTRQLLGDVMSRQKRFEEAETALRQLVTLYSSSSEPGGSCARYALHVLTMLLFKHKKYAEAVKTSRRLAMAQQMSRNLDAAHTIVSLRDLDAAKSCNYKPLERELLLRRILETEENSRGPDHEHTIEVMARLAQALCENEKDHEAAFYYRQAYEIFTRRPAPMTQSTFEILKEYAHCLCRIQDYQNAKKLIEGHATVSEKVLGSKHFETIDGMRVLGCILAATGEFDEANIVFQRVVNTWMEQFGDEDTRIIAVKRAQEENLKKKQEVATAEVEIQRKGIEAGERCLYTELDIRGAVVFVGHLEPPFLGRWVGVRLDTPDGQRRGMLNGKRYFGTDADDVNHYVFAAADSVEIGDYPVLDVGEEETNEVVRSPETSSASST